MKLFALVAIATLGPQTLSASVVTFSSLRPGGTYIPMYFYDNEFTTDRPGDEQAFRFVASATGYLTEVRSALVVALGPCQVYLTFYADDGTGPGAPLGQYIVTPGTYSSASPATAWTLPLDGRVLVEAGASYYISVRRITGEWRWFTPNPPPAPQTTVASRPGSGGDWQANEADVVALELRVPECGSADFNHDGDSGTDADIEAFFACLGGSCCATCESADFNQDGDIGTDADIESFFRVLGGGNC